VGRDGTSLPDLYQTRKTSLAKHRGIVHARPAPVRALHPPPVRRRSPQGRGNDDRALHGMALRPRTRKDLAGPLPVRHPQFLQLPAGKRSDRDFARRVRRYAQIRTPAARHPHHRRDRQHHRHGRHALDQRAARQRHARSALLVRPARLRADLAAAFGPLFRRRIHPRHRQRQQTAAGADQQHGAGQDTAVSRRAAQRTFGCFSTTAADSSRA